MKECIKWDEEDSKFDELDEMSDKLRALRDRVEVMGLKRNPKWDSLDSGKEEPHILDLFDELVSTIENEFDEAA
jgi:hypothetical protein